MEEAIKHYNENDDDPNEDQTDTTTTLSGGDAASPFVRRSDSGLPIGDSSDFPEELRPIMQGWLVKFTPKLGSSKWKLRWAVFSKIGLAFYKTPNDPVPTSSVFMKKIQGVVEVDQVFKVIKQKKTFRYGFKLLTVEGDLTFACEDQLQVQNWLREIRLHKGLEISEQVNKKTQEKLARLGLTDIQQDMGRTSSDESLSLHVQPTHQEMAPTASAPPSPGITRAERAVSAPTTGEFYWTQRHIPTDHQTNTPVDAAGRKPLIKKLLPFS